MDIVIMAPKQWSLIYAEQFKLKNCEIATHIFTERNELTFETLSRIKPKYVFFPHWSWYIPNEIFENFTCVVFHPSDVPFGRGGTPIQNLIGNGHTETAISAIKANGEIDGGDIFIKRKLSLLGGGEEIMLRMQSIVFNDMIPHIIKNNPLPQPQTGTPTTFKRRTPEMSEINSKMTIDKIFDTIRMLDIDGYPKAFMQFGDYCLTFSRPSLLTNGIEATVRISERSKNG